MSVKAGQHSASVVNNPLSRGLKSDGGLWPGQGRADDQAQEKPQPVEEEAEVEVGGGQDGVDGVALRTGEIVAIHAMAVLDVADDGLDGEAAGISRLMAGVMRRFWPEVKILNL